MPRTAGAGITASAAPVLREGAMAISRRRFVGGITAALGYLGLRPEPNLWAQTPAASGKGQGQSPARATRSGRDALTVEEYDSFAKLANNENPYGPPESVMKAMTQAFKYSNRYGYPDGGIVQEIATH